jgi:hypothetical protein
MSWMREKEKGRDSLTRLTEELSACRGWPAYYAMSRTFVAPSRPSSALNDSNPVVVTRVRLEPHGREQRPPAEPRPHNPEPQSVLQR